VRYAPWGHSRIKLVKYPVLNKDIRFNTAMPWSLYIIECCDKTLYTGITTDISRRLKEHNSKSKKGAFYTRNKTPVKLVYQEGVVGGRSAALKLERAIKSLTRKQKLELISGK
jgi:putative endonuclease